MAPHALLQSSFKATCQCAHLKAAGQQSRSLQMPPCERRPVQAVLRVQQRCRQLAAKSAGLGLAALVACTGPALATDKVGSFEASGLIFKDSVEVIAQEDPAVKGVTIYISDFNRSLTDKLNSNFFDEPSQASVTCAITAPIQIPDYKAIAGDKEVFSQAKGINFLQNKTLRVRRLYDAKHSTLLYVAYSTRLSNDSKTNSTRYKTSVCALPIAPEVTTATSNPNAQIAPEMK